MSNGAGGASPSVPPSALLWDSGEQSCQFHFHYECGCLVWYPKPAALWGKGLDGVCENLAPTGRAASEGCFWQKPGMETGHQGQEPGCHVNGLAQSREGRVPIWCLS